MVPGHPIAFDFTEGGGSGSAYVKHPQMRIMSLCVSLWVSIAFSVCLSVCLSIRNTCDLS